MLVFQEGGKPEYPKKTLEQGGTQQPPQPTYDTGRSHNCAIPAPK